MNQKAITATARLKQDYLRLKRDPIPYIQAEPLPSNILEWHYVVTGPEATPFEGGYYHGKLVFPREFPFKPPAIYMLTPSGRFTTNSRLCLSISDFHPDTWNPAWSVSTILTGLLSFMNEKSRAVGSIESSDYEKRELAALSLQYNLKDKLFCDLFPETAGLIQAELAIRSTATRAAELEHMLHHQVTSEQSNLHALFTNICVVLTFAAFALTVKYVLTTISSE